MVRKKCARILSENPGHGRYIGKNNLKLGCWNINGLIDSNGCSKLLDEHVSSLVTNLDIFALVETHIGSETHPVLKNYWSYSVCRQKSKNNRFFGGITVFIKESIKKGITVIDHMKSADHIWLKLCKAHFTLERDIFLCICYIPPDNSTYLYRQSNDIIKTIERDIMTLPNDSHLIICGDLNARTGFTKDYISQDDNNYIPLPNNYACDTQITPRLNQDPTLSPRGQQLIDMCISSQLIILNGRMLGDSAGYFTCHKYNGSSVVDYMITSRNLYDRAITLHVNKYNASVSDHCLITAEFDIRSQYKREPLHQTWCPMPSKVKFDKHTISLFQTILSTAEIKMKINDIANQTNETETKLIALNNILISVASQAGAIRDRQPRNRGKRNRAKWHNRYYTQLKRKVQSLSAELSRYPYNKSLRQQVFCNLKKLRKLNKQLKRGYLDRITSQLEDLHQANPKAYWQLVHELDEINNQHLSNPAEGISAEKWIKHYTELNTPNIPKAVEECMHNIMLNTKRHKTFTTLDYRITEKEILQACHTLKNGKAVGTDGISNEMIKYSMPQTLHILHPLLNEIFTSSHFPKQWAEVYINNLHKSGSALDPGNYRGISVGNALGKLFSSILNKRLTDYLIKNKLLSNCQIGFLKDSRTSDHIFTLKTIIDKYRKIKKQNVYLCFIDFRKAFDRVWHTGLFHKLQNIGINGKFHEMIRNMYSKITLRVKTDNGLSSPIHSNIGVRQGDILSPLLFNIYINDLTEILSCPKSDLVSLNDHEIPCLMYADDIVLMATSQRGLQNQLNSLHEYCSKWYLDVNTNKTKSLVVSHKTFNIDFNYGTENIEQVDSFPYLGIMINSKGNFTDNTQRLCNKSL